MLWQSRGVGPLRTIAHRRHHKLDVCAAREKPQTRRTGLRYLAVVKNCPAPKGRPITAQANGLG